MAHETEWPEPEPIPAGLPDVPTFEPSLLPAVFRPWVEDISERMQSPPDFCAIPLMVSLSAVVGCQIAIRPGQFDDWAVVPNLWGAIIGRPGTLKTPAMRQAMGPIQALESAAKRAYESELKEYRASQSEDEDCHGSADSEPQRRRYVTQDSTPEKLADLLGINTRGILVFRDELTGWFDNLGKQGQESGRSFYLEAWNGGGSFTVDRIKRGTVDIESATVSVLGGLQPGPLADIVQHSGGRGRGDDGLLQRFQLLAWPDPPLDWRPVDRPPDQIARDRVFDAFKRLDRIDARRLGVEIDSIPFLRFDDSARSMWVEWRGMLENRLRIGSESAAFESALAKYRSLVPSLALLCHLVDEPDGGPVGAPALDRAIRWASYLESHSRRVYAPRVRPDLESARLLSRRLAGRVWPDEVSTRDVYRKGWENLGTVDAAGAALACLAEFGWVSRKVEQSGPGRPSERYRINPRIFDSRT